MRQDVTLYKCERCGLERGYRDVEDFGVVMPADKVADADGWTTRYDKDLCKSCADEYDAMLDKFFNEIWDK